MEDNPTGITPEDLRETVEITFHGIPYIVSASTVGWDTLCIEVEQKSDASRWRGDFSSRYIEDITAKTGNFKKFPVYVRMLQSALQQQSDCVFVDLLTYQDLELLKSKRSKSGGQLLKTIPPNNKRYLILTYAAEFDRVHYPLPLMYEESPDPEHLKGIIRDLRAQLDQVGNKGDPSHSKVKKQQNEVERLREEISALKDELRGIKQPNSFVDEDDEDHQPGDRQGLQWKELLTQLKMVKRERDLLQSRADAFDVELERERATHRREMKKKMQELAEAQHQLLCAKEQVKDLRIRCKELTKELEAARTRTRQRTEDRSRVPGGAYAPSSKLYSRPGSTTSRASSQRTSPANSRGPSPQRSRGTDPYSTSSYSRPNSAPARGRFDPTEYVRQKKEKARALERERSLNRPGSSGMRSGGSSRHESPAGSRPGSGQRARPEALYRSSSMERNINNSRPSSTSSQWLSGHTSSGYNPPPSERRPTPGKTAPKPMSKFPSRPEVSQRSSSPGRALLDVKNKLSQITQQRVTARPSSPGSKEAEKAAPPPSEPKKKIFDDASHEIADIDSRLHALQNFLKMAKANAGCS